MLEDKVDKKRVIDGIRAEIENSKGTRIWSDYVNALKSISQVAFTRISGFVLELIQNAEDAGLGLESPGVFDIRINKQRIKVTHNGAPFTETDVKALCGIGSSKKPEKGTLGYLGIGFKSVFKVTDCPQVYSNDFQFKFDRNAWSDPSETPWHTMPIWIDEPSETIDPERTAFIILYEETKAEDYCPPRARNPHRRQVQYHEFAFILTAYRRLLRGGAVSLIDIAFTDPLIGKIADELQKSKPVPHPDILSGVTDQKEQDSLKGFLTGLTGVQILDTKDVCRNTLLPKIQTNAPKPLPDDLVKYTTCCQRILGREIDSGLEFWILTKQGDVRPAKEVFFSSEFTPDPGRNWETQQKYVSGLSFISPCYRKGLSADDQLVAWRAFFKAGAVKDAPDNGVEEFAMNYAEEKLEAQHKNVTRVDKRNFGYDLEVETQTGENMQVEVKGQSSEKDVELTGNETEAADKYKDAFYLCVVSSIPGNPEAYTVRNPAAVGKKEKLTIPVDIWRQKKWA